MKIFISWSGAASKQAAAALKEWLESCIQTLEVFMSSESIESGSRWFSEIGGKLDEIDYGIVCVDSSNQTSPWLLFEAGALAKKVEKAKVVPFLLDIKPSQITGPLSQFQGRTWSDEDIKKILKDINGSTQNPLDSQRLERQESHYTPKLLESLIVAKSLIGKDGRLRRDQYEMLEEILLIVRDMANWNKQNELAKALVGDVTESKNALFNTLFLSQLGGIGGNEKKVFKGLFPIFDDEKSDEKDENSKN